MYYAYMYICMYVCISTSCKKHTSWTNTSQWPEISGTQSQKSFWADQAGSYQRRNGHIATPRGIQRIMKAKTYLYTPTNSICSYCNMSSWYEEWQQHCKPMWVRHAEAEEVEEQGSDLAKWQMPHYYYYFHLLSSPLTSSKRIQWNCCTRARICSRSAHIFIAAQSVPLQSAAIPTCCCTLLKAFEWRWQAKVCCSNTCSSPPYLHPKRLMRMRSVQIDLAAAIYRCWRRYMPPLLQGVAHAHKNLCQYVTARVCMSLCVFVIVAQNSIIITANTYGYRCCCHRFVLAVCCC